MDDQSYGNVAYFDWRARHDANNASPNSKYYNEYGNGWITHLSCQGEGFEFDTCSFITFLDDSTMNQNKCESMGGNWHGAPTCWIFAATAQVEAMTNLYFNQFINPDLSEQYIVCKDGVSYNGSVLGGFCKYALDRFKSDYVVVEDALPYTASNCNCDDTIWDPLSERIRIDSFAEITPVSIDDVKRALVQYGPLATGKIPDPYGMDHHAMLLV
jgi:Papain family cysteine protease.